MEIKRRKIEKEFDTTRKNDQRMNVEEQFGATNANAKEKQTGIARNETNPIARERRLKLGRSVMRHIITEGVKDNKLRCTIDEEFIDARNSVPRKSVDIATDGAQLSVECQGEEDGGKNTTKVLGDKTRPAEQLEVPRQFSRNFKMKIAAVKMGNMGDTTPNKVSEKCWKYLKFVSEQRRYSKKNSG